MLAELVSINESLVSCYYAVENLYPHRKEDFFKSIKTNQLRIRLWLSQKFNEVEKNSGLKSAIICANGFGLYDNVLVDHMNLNDIDFYDYDPEVIALNWQAFKNLNTSYRKINQTCLNVINDIEYIRRDTDVVINLSCECMFDSKFMTSRKFEKNPTFCLMGSNKMEKGNINVHSTISSFVESTGLENVSFSGKFDFDDETKYLVIGKKF